MRATMAALAVAMLFGASCGAGDDAGAGNETTTTTIPASGEFTALTYNVAGLPDILSGSNPEANMPHIARLLNDYELVLTQEDWRTPDPNPIAPTRFYHEILAEGSAHKYQSESEPQPLGRDASRPTALLADGLHYFSDFPLGDVTHVAWESCFGDAETGAGDCLAFKGFSVVTMTLPGSIEVDVYNLHGEAGSTPEDQTLQHDDFEQLGNYIVENSDGRAIIFGGDTNLHTDIDPEDPQDAEDKQIWEEFLGVTGLTDVCDAVGCDEPGRIDKFAYRSNDDVVLEATSWEFEIEKFQRDDGEPLSDHDALAVTFRWETR
ncbi:MAG: hypothetical protein U5K30_10550 [Acidimicrobiales bacterium]|nr:hypothetical protein [Acidimicrobiales bacterium]